MAWRKGYKDGGAVKPQDAAPAPVAPVIDKVEPPPAPPPPEDGLKEALEAQRRAEELQRQPPPPPKPVEISERKKEILKLNPHLAHAVMGPTVGAIHNAILQSGVVDDSDEYVDAMANALGQVGVRFEKPQLTHEQQHEPVSEPSHHEPEPPAYEPEPAPLASMPAPEPYTPPAAPMPTRRVPMSAPVSRSAPSYSGDARPGVTTLTAEQREVARKSMPNTPPHEAEKLYAEGLRRMNARRAAGYRDERDGQ